MHACMHPCFYVFVGCKPACVHLEVEDPCWSCPHAQSQVPDTGALTEPGALQWPRVPPSGLRGSVHLRPLSYWGHRCMLLHIYITLGAGVLKSSSYAPKANGFLTKPSPLPSSVCYV